MRSNLLCDAIRRSRGLALRSLAIMTLIFLMMFGIGGSAHAQMTRQQIIGKIERDYGVEVLKVGPAKDMGPNVLAVTVMSPSGDFNEAFQVNTLAVDAKSGELVLVGAQTAQGYRHSAPPVTQRTSPLMGETP